MVFLPLIIVWSILNVLNGGFEDIFYGLLIMNWSLGIIMLLIARGLMIKTFNEDKKSFLYILKVIYIDFLVRWVSWFKPSVC